MVLVTTSEFCDIIQLAQTIKGTFKMLDVLKLSKSVTVCECCNKSNLKQTIEIILKSNEIVYYCKNCAVRLTGKSMQNIIIEIRKIQHSIIEFAKEEYFSSDEYKNLFAARKADAFNSHKINYDFNYCKFDELAKIKKDFIAKKYKISSETISIL